MISVCHIEFLILRCSFGAFLCVFQNVLRRIFWEGRMFMIKYCSFAFLYCNCSPFQGAHEVRLSSLVKLRSILLHIFLEHQENTQNYFFNGVHLLFSSNSFFCQSLPGSEHILKSIQFPCGFARYRDVFVFYMKQSSFFFIEYHLFLN